MKKTLQKAVKAAASLVLSLALLVSGSVSASALLLEKGGIYVADYPSTAEAMEAANKLNTLLSAEGDVLLKNDGTLPLFGDEKISVFGGMQRNPVGASGTGLLAVLREEGFDVNPVLEGFYSSNGSIGSERLNFSAEQEQSLDLYHDAALIVLSRTGGEGADLAMVTNEAEDNTDGDGNVYDWTHESLGLKEDVEYKHYLELTDSEEALISYVKARFDKIIVIINTSNAMELANLQEDDDINAIVWIGRPGSTGLKALAQILSGEVNPSGRLVDEWYRDFTADPTWENFGSNSQVGISYDYIYNVEGAPNGLRGIDYDEGIYVGYKYYETVFAEIAAGNLGYDAETKRIVKEGGETGPEAAEAWWSYAVVYPFGYGLSYTTFEESFEKLYYLEDGKKVDLEGTVDGDDLFSSAAGSEAKVKELYADVKVTNTGAMAGKQVVQIYVTAPYTVGGIEKAGVTLVGFAKTAKIRPGQSQVVTVKFNVQDMASFDYNDVNANEFFGYELEAGEYIVKVMEDSHRVADEKSFTLETGATLALDDFSGNEIDNVFSKGDMFDTIRKNNDPENPDSPLNVNVSNEAGQVLLSRADLSTEAVLALRPTVEEQTLSDAFVKSVVFWMQFTAADQA
ncbi:MAG: glycoside hydrolase family 3 C-terminal domain-containing protein, partial [Lachnospiraceae bacterium]|nr:glycoside hydrolase family 3 C-terminal domain-containing protein [Lachnospiraceae bacterium]